MARKGNNMKGIYKIMIILAAIFIFAATEDTAQVHAAEAGEMARSSLSPGVYDWNTDRVATGIYVINGDVTINGYGSTITNGMSSATGCCFVVKSGTLTLNDLNINGNLCGGKGYSSCVSVQGTGRLVMNGGSIYNSTENGLHIECSSSEANQNPSILTGVRLHHNNRGAGFFGSVKFYNCEIDNNETFGIHTNPGLGAGNAELFDCSIHHNGVYGCQGANRMVIERTTIYGNPYGVYMGQMAGAEQSLSMDGCYIYDCLIGVYLENSLGTMLNSAIQNCDSGILVEQGATANVDGVTGNGNIRALLNYGTAQVNRVTFAGNTYGIFNQSQYPLVYSSGTIQENDAYDIYQEGSDFTMNNTATARTRGIYLAKNCRVKIAAALSCQDASIPLTLAEDYLTPGVVCIENNAGVATEAMAKKFVLRNTHTATATDKKMPNGTYQRVAVLRVGNGSNGGDAGKVVLSEEYYLSFAGNINNPRITQKLPSNITLYWREHNEVYLGSASIFYQNRPFHSLTQTGWSEAKDGSGKRYTKNGMCSFKPAESTRDYIFYPIWNGAANLLIDGNEQTTGDNYTIFGFVCKKNALPENTFTKEEHSFQGWSLSPTAIYKDAGVWKPGEKPDFTNRLLDDLNHQRETVNENGYMDLPCYVVWDAFPVMTGADKYMTKQQLQERELTEETLLQWMSATDREDGTDIDLKVLDFDAKEALRLGEQGYVTISYQATDGVKNTSYQTIRLHVTEGELYQGRTVENNPAYVRFVDETCYNAKKPKRGGLMEESVWYESTPLAEELQTAFERIAQDDYIMRYEFDRAAIEKSQEYVREHGPGNYTSYDNLARYFDRAKK